ncbi:MAG TPA: flagellar FlbD family protein [Anaerolineaceae bacterium]|nr:flagellar FlbD family protein [Anaerolineaceae bacterium]
MILVTRLNNKTFYINAEMIRTVEATPDTVISFQDDTKLVIKEPAQVVVKRIIEYQRLVKNPQIELAPGE